MLELQSVVKHYQVGLEPIRAVDGVSLDVGPGELVVIYGPSGSGKTTLLNLIAGVLQPDAGRVLVDGRPLDELSRDELDHYRLQQLGIIGQPGDLIGGWRAIESASLKLWLAGTSNGNIQSLLERLGLGARMRHRTEQLSMGERQRVMIAQALSTHPALVLADEPTGSLDTQRSLAVLELLRSESHQSGTAVVLVTHDPEAASFADAVHALQDGKLVDYEIQRNVPADRTA